MGKSCAEYNNDIRFYIHFRLPCDTAMYDFNYRIQSLADELEPHCDSLLKINCDIARNLTDDLILKYGEEKGTFILDKDLVEKALDYTVYVEILCPDDSLDKISSVIAHLISEVSPPAQGEDSAYSVGVDIEPIDPNHYEPFIAKLVENTQILSANRSENLSPLVLYKFDAFKPASKNKTPVDMLDAALDAGMVIFEPPYQTGEEFSHSSKGTAYIYADVNNPAILVDDDGEPVIMARYHDDSLTPQGDRSEFMPGWVVLRVIAIPKMPSLAVIAHCLNNHPMQAGFGDGVFSFISPMLLLSKFDSARYVTLIGTVFNGFIDGNGVTFIDHIDIDGDFIAEIPMKDMYQYLLSIDELHEVAGDFSIELLKENVKDLRFSAESYDTEHVVKH